LKSDWQKRTIKINKNSVLFIASENNDIHEVEDSLNLLDVLKDSDMDVLGGRCCESIGLLPEEPEEIKVGIDDLFLYCFDITDKT